MTRKPDDWMPLHIGDYHADTAHLSRDQHGAYFLLLMAYWRRGGPLPADDARLAAIAKATPAEWRKLRPVLLEFFTEEGGAWKQKRAEEELAVAFAKTNAKAAAGKKGADARWQTYGKRIATAHASENGKPMAGAPISHRQTDAPLPSTLTEEEPLTSFAVAREEIASEPVVPEIPQFLDRRKRATALPEDFPDAEALRRAQAFWTERQRLDLSHSVRDQAEQFRAHHTAKGTRSKDWAASWRTWIGNALEFNKDKTNGRASPHDKFLAGGASYIAKLEARERESEDDRGADGPTGPGLLPGGLRSGTG